AVRDGEDSGVIKVLRGREDSEGRRVNRASLEWQERRHDAVLLQGDLGQRGDEGLKGEQGPRGEPGGRGATGLKGSCGPTGRLGHPGPAGLHGVTGEPGLPGQVYVLPGLQGETGDQGPPAQCNCSQVQTPERLMDRIQTIFIADGEKQMRRLRAENVMVLRTDRKALYIYTESQWINVLVTTAGETQRPHKEGRTVILDSRGYSQTRGPQTLTPRSKTSEASHSSSAQTVKLLGVNV
ncbi:hypothetical protein L3Q82_017270, partial [Scortum barcoo]